MMRRNTWGKVCGLDSETGSERCHDHYSAGLVLKGGSTHLDLFHESVCSSMGKNTLQRIDAVVLCLPTKEILINTPELTWKDLMNVHSRFRMPSERWRSLISRKTRNSLKNVMETRAFSASCTTKKFDNLPWGSLHYFTTILQVFCSTHCNGLHWVGLLKNNTLLSSHNFCTATNMMKSLWDSTFPQDLKISPL